MEIPSGQIPNASTRTYQMRLPAPPGLPPNQQSVPIGQMPGHWQPGMPPDMPGLARTGASMCADIQSHSWPGSHYWGLTSAPWRQEVPSTMPWAGRRPGMVSFTGVPPCSSSPDQTRPVAATCKRRLETGEEEPTNKHFLTEDMMADHFNCLSLENDHAYGASGFPSRGHPDGKWHQWLSDYTRFQELEGRLHTDQPSATADGKDGEDEVFVEGEYTMGDTPILTVSAELKESLRDGAVGSILPEKVLRSMNHPCMELVLWKPPGNLIHEAIRSLTRQRNSSQDQKGCNGRTTPLGEANGSLNTSPLGTDIAGCLMRRGVLQDPEDAMEL
ncbi:host cell factor C1 regulator 1 [Ambystoma mexicanum]|uniref:host cell factor C1 regulator 1 n=1 Tax=Ambystoma mexicanum TaxID=8296 RepID=UPI0037E91E1D